MRPLRPCDLCGGADAGVATCRRCEGTGWDRTQRPYLAWVRRLPCLGCGRGGPSDAHHEWLDASDHGVGFRAPDHQALPLCRRCHRRRTDGSRDAFWGDLSGDLAGAVETLVGLHEAEVDVDDWTAADLGVVLAMAVGAWRWTMGGP